jgi:hypothetical protein
LTSWQKITFWAILNEESHAVSKYFSKRTWNHSHKLHVYDHFFLCVLLPLVQAKGGKNKRKGYHKAFFNVDEFLDASRSFNLEPAIQNNLS